MKEITIGVGGLPQGKRLIDDNAVREMMNARNDSNTINDRKKI